MAPTVPFKARQYRIPVLGRIWYKDGLDTEKNMIILSKLQNDISNL